MNNNSWTDPITIATLVAPLLAVLLAALIRWLGGGR